MISGLLGLFGELLGVVALVILFAWVLTRFSSDSRKKRRERRDMYKKRHEYDKNIEDRPET